MALRMLFRPIQCIITKNSTTKFNMFLHKNRQFLLHNKKNYSCKVPEKAPSKCPSKSCNKKKSFWSKLFSSKKNKKSDEVMTTDDSAVKCCRIKFYDREDPDLSTLGGEAYRTCGTAYIVQKDRLVEDTQLEPEDNKESAIIKKMEIHPSLKQLVDDSVPDYKTVPQRLLDFSDKKLHPLFEKLRNTPKPCTTGSNLDGKCPVYKTVSGPIAAEDIPLNIKFNKELLEKKNMFSEIKRVDPPIQLVGRLVEMRRNQRPTLERINLINLEMKKKSAKKVECKRPQKEVFDTLVQKVGANK